VVQFRPWAPFLLLTAYPWFDSAVPSREWQD
jgi:hypothetical protein